MSVAPIAILTGDQLRDMLAEAAELGARRALTLTADATAMLSLVQAARRARRRRADVLAALRSGKLPGAFDSDRGSRGCWRIRAGDVDAWASKADR